MLKLCQYAFVFLLTQTFLLSASFDFTQEELHYIQQKKVITLSSEPDWPPYDYTEDGKPTGYSIELMQLLTRDLGFKVKFITANWDELVDKFCAGEIDVLHPTDLSERALKCGLMTKQILLDTSMFAVRKDFKEYKGIEDFFGYRLATPKGWYQTELFKELYKGKIEIVEVENTEEALEDVIRGKADFAFDFGNVLNYLLLKNNYHGLKIVGPYTFENNDESLYIGVNKNEPILYSIFQKALEHINLKEVEKLKKKWLYQGSDIYLWFSAPEQEYMKKHPTIKICLTSDNTPFEFSSKQKNFEGISADFLHLIEQKVPIKFEPYFLADYESSISALKQGDCDIVPSALKDLHVKSSEPYIFSAFALVTNNSKPFVDDLSALQGKRLAITKKYMSLIPEKIDFKLLEVENLEEGFELVRSGKVYGYVDSLISLANYIQTNGIVDLKISGKSEKQNIDFSFAMRNDEIELQSILNKTLKDISEETKKDIYNKWYYVKIEQKDIIDYDALKKVALLIIVLGLFSMYKQMLLRKLNKELKTRVAQEVEKSQEKDHIIHQQNKMLALAEMLENIAHQWRQPLSEVNSAVCVIDDELYAQKIQNSTIENELLHIENLCAFMSSTIKDFKNFYSADKEINRFFIQEIVAKTVKMVEHVLRNNTINISIYIKEDISVLNYPNELQQVLLNLLSNAKDAFKQLNTDDKKISIIGEEIDGWVKISVIDNAGGIAPEVLEKVFDKYFTTKKNLQGSGLGLYTSKTIIEKSMKGKLSLESSGGLTKANIFITDIKY